MTGSRYDLLFDLEFLTRLESALEDAEVLLELADEAGRRLAKRDDARSLKALREAGHSPAEVRALAGFPDAATG